jgi:hypothetical protein
MITFLHHILEVLSTIKAAVLTEPHIGFTLSSGSLFGEFAVDANGRIRSCPSDSDTITVERIRIDRTS